VVAWRKLASLSSSEFATLDIAQINLACAVDLSGSEKIDAGQCLRTLDCRRWQGYGFLDQKPFVWIKSTDLKTLPSFLWSRSDRIFIGWNQETWTSTR
jgi:hypothetical protein